MKATIFRTVFTFSVHDRSIFPGTGHPDDPDNYLFNRPLELASDCSEHEGMVKAVRQVRHAFRDTPILLRGAGGYQPDTVTPEVWARMAIAVATPVARNDQFLVDCSDEIGYFDDSDERNAFHRGTHNNQVLRNLLED